MISFTWKYNQNSNCRIRTFLFSKKVSRALLKQIKFHGGKIIVNHKQRFPSYFLKFGDVITIILPKELSNPNVLISHQPINIIYEDNNFLIVNKPYHLNSIPNSLNSNDSLINRVKGYLLEKHLSSKTHIVTRLDSDTSGLVIFAKHHYAHSILDDELKHHELKKWYIAIVEGHFSNNHYEIDLPIGRDKNSYIKRKIDSNGKNSKTEFWVLKQNLKISLIKIRLHTGRTHQIRIHLSAIGHPLLGDWLYNAEDEHLQRQALHCFKIQFKDLFHNDMIKCEATLPYDMQNLINKI